MEYYGLIGKKLVHSFSKGYFSDKFKNSRIDAQYDLIEIQVIDEIAGIISDARYSGLNVTIPYKQQILPFLDELSPEAEIIGAVNTISFHRQGRFAKLKGWNTDAPAFESEILEFTASKPVKAIILGSGGAALAAESVFRKLGWDYLLTSRNKSSGNIITYQELPEALLKGFTLLINATPLGMYPDVESIPDIPWHLIDDKCLLFDMVYNPETTRFLAEGKKRGAAVRNGLGMLTKQAELAWNIWQSNKFQEK